MLRGNETRNVAREQANRAGTTENDYRLTVLRKQLNAIVEKVEVLNGERKKAMAKAAVRRGDIAAPTLKAKKVTAAPTAEDFNALVTDIRALAASLDKLSS